jgi:short subunit fatty acids transporter
MRKQKIIIMLILALLLVLSACTENADEKNEEILKKILELEEIDINKVEIQKDTIFVSMEASSAGEYDTQILEWWGAIFGISGMLKGDYLVVIIENTVNKEAYTYISTNIYTIRDFTEDRISDAEFWDETLITSIKPKTNEIIDASGLPIQTLKDEKDVRVPLTTTTKIIIAISLILLIITLLVIVLVKRKKRKKQKAQKDKQEVKQEVKQEKKKEKKKTDHIKKIKEKIKKETDKLKEKTKEKTKSFKEKLKQEPGR